MTHINEHVLMFSLKSLINEEISMIEKPGQRTT